MNNATVKIGLDTSAVGTGLAAVKAQFANLRNDLVGMSAGSLLPALGAGALTAAAGQIIEKAGAIGDLAAQFDISAESLQRIGNAAKLNGSSMEAAGAALNKLALATEKVRKGNEEAAQSLKTLGIEAAEFVNLNPEQAFFRIADAVKVAEDRQAAYAAVIQLMGKSSGELFTTLELGADDIRALGESLGIFTNDAVDRLSELGDAIDAAKGRATTLGGELLVYADKLVRMLNLSAKFTGANFASAFLALKQPAPLLDRLTEASKLFGKGFFTIADGSFRKMAGDIWEGRDLEKPKRGKGSPRALLNGEEGEGGSARTKEQELARLVQLRERLALLEREAMLSQLTAEQKLKFLADERLAIQKRLWESVGEEARLKEQIALAEKDREIAALEREKDRQSGRGKSGGLEKDAANEVIADRLTRKGLGGGAISRAAFNQMVDDVQKPGLSVVRAPLPGAAGLAAAKRAAEPMTVMKELSAKMEKSEQHLKQIEKNTSGSRWSP